MVMLAHALVTHNHVLHVLSCYFYVEKHLDSRGKPIIWFWVPLLGGPNVAPLEEGGGETAGELYRRSIRLVGQRYLS